MSKLTVTFIALALPACNSFAQPEAWLFVQSVGGIKIGVPFRKETGWILPVHSDVSGLNTISVEPTTLNSGLSCQRTEATIEGDAIFLEIFTGVAGSGRSSVCPAASLRHPRAGKYSVFYRSANQEPVAIGEVSIGL